MKTSNRFIKCLGVGLVTFAMPLSLMAETKEQGVQDASLFSPMFYLGLLLVLLLLSVAGVLSLALNRLPSEITTKKH